MGKYQLVFYSIKLFASWNQRIRQSCFKVAQNSLQQLYFDGSFYNLLFKTLFNFNVFKVTLNPMYRILIF